jgi:hypothetical protein
MRLVIWAVGAILALPFVGLAGADEPLSPVSLPEGDLTAQVIAHPNIALSRAAASDVGAGIADARALSLLIVLSENHTLSVGPIRTGHSYYIRGTHRVSKHVFGRAVDITRVDGASVSPSNLGAFEATETILSLPSPVRPDEVGSPWRLSGRGSFTDLDHRDHIHVGWS